MSKFSSFFSPTAPTSQNGSAPAHPASPPSAPYSGGRGQSSTARTVDKPRLRGQSVPWPFPPKPPYDDRDAHETRSRRWLTGLAVLVLVLAAFGLGLAVASPSTAPSRSALVFEGPVQQLTPFTPASKATPPSQTKAFGRSRARPMTPLGTRPGAGKAKARALLVKHGALANIVFSASVPTSGFAVYLTGGIGKGRHSGDSLLALHREGAMFAATPYPLARLAKYRWLAVFALGRHNAPAHPILTISLKTLSAQDGVSLSAPATTHH